MRWLADSNLLLRGADDTSPMQEAALSTLARIRARGDEVWIVPQNLYEFWVVATRPVERNGLGMSAAEAKEELASIQQLFPLLDDQPGIAATWQALIDRYNTVGVRAHDTRLVAAMLVHGLTHLLTFNVDDFRRYTEITVVHPNDV